MSVAVDAILRAVPTFALGPGSKMQNVHHLLHTTGSVQNEADVVEACSDWIDDVYGVMVVQLHNTVSALDVAVFERVAGAWDPIGNFAPLFAGTNAGVRLPAGVCAMVRLLKERTGYADRRYISGFTEGGVTSDVWDNSVLTVLGNFAAKFLVEFTATNGVKLTPCYYDRKTGATKLYISTAPVAAVSYQRRRKPGVGLT